MISFIVIGKNEAFFLAKCFQSIDNIINKYNFNYEKIYVDSGSTDNSIEIARKYDVKVISVSGQCNAAIGRNLGAKESIGENLIFLDGDMEIQQDFFDVVVNEDGSLVYSYVSGDILNKYFDSSMKFINEGYYYKYKLFVDKYLPYTGGFFCIRRDLWYSVNGMKEKFRRSQDLDFGLRLSENKTYLLRKKELAIIHNTISYFEKKRIIRIIINNDFGYRAMLIRDHLFNPYIYRMLIRQDYTLLFLALCVLLSILAGIEFPFLIYLILIGLRAAFQTDDDKNSRISKIFFIIAKDVQMLISFFLFYPKRKKSYQILVIK